MNTKMKMRMLSLLLCFVVLVGLVPTSVFAAGGTEFVHFAIKEHWGVYFEQTGSSKNYPVTLTNENKLSVPIPTLYRTDSDDYVFDGWYIAETDTKVTQDTVFDGYTIIVDRWTFQEKDENTLVKNISIENVELEAGMTTAEYNAAVFGANATVHGITSDSAKTYTIYHGLNKSGDPLGADEEVEVGQDYSVVTTIKLADGYTFDENLVVTASKGTRAGVRYLGGAGIYTKEWNTLANSVEVTINFMNTEYYFAQTPESRNLENYAQYRNWYKVSKMDGLESVTLQYEVDGQWAIFIDNIPFEAVGSEAGGYVTVSPYVDITKTFRLVANYTHGKVYSEPFEVSWACLTPVIESIGIGVTAPQNGYSPEYTITTDTNRCALKSENSATVKNGIKWTGDVAGELAVSGSKFDNDNDYTVSIKLVAQDGYTFANNVTATINANNANVSVESDNEIRISYTFPKPEKQKWYVSFFTSPTYASGTMQSVQVEEGEYTLPEPTYTPNAGYVFEGWLVKGLLKQPGDVITVTENIILNAKWKDTNDYDAPHGFTKQPADASNIVGMQIQYSVDNFTVDPSITYENVIAQIYDSESGEWTTATTEVSAGNGIVENYGQQFIIFSSDAVGEFTFRLYATQGSTKVAISENFTVTWTPKQFTTQPQGDMVVVGETVTVTAEKNFYAEKYEIEYNDGGVWKLYQEVTGSGWNAFSLDFTSNEAKSVTFRINAYAEGDVYDEENDCFPIVLIDTSEEFTITWTSNEHVHTYGAIPNGKDATNHWKECTDPACPDKAHSKIEVEVHKDNTADYKCDACGYDMPVVTYTVTFNANGGTGSMADATGVSGDYVLPVCGFTAPNGKQFKAWSVGGVEKAAGDTITVNANTTVTAIWKDAPHTHTFDQETIKDATLKTAADCTHDAVYYKSCSCGEISTDDADTFTATDSALGHDLVKNADAVNPTCFSVGWTAGYKCSRCDYEVRQKEVAKIAHTTKTTTTRATTAKDGKIVKTCTVCKKTLSTTVIPKASYVKLSATSYTYNGKVKTPSVTVKNSKGKTLVKNTDYTVSYAKGRKYVGKYAVNITFKGKYSGTKTLYFTIVPKATSISSLTAGSKKFTVKWKKQATQTTGYQIQYSTSSKFTKYKTVTIGKNSTTSKTISKLSAKKKYYVRVRTYKTVKINGKATKIYSSWSKAKTVTTKK